MWFKSSFTIQAVVAISLCLIGGTSPALADIINVPGDFPTIQEAIDAAMDGDEVVVHPGTYNENIYLLGKAINLHSSDGPDVTTIDAQGSGAVVTCVGVGPDTVLDGFTITGGGGSGGMYNQGSSPTVINCTFSGNWAVQGGGMHNTSSSSPTVTNCTFSGNTAIFGGGPGGGMYNVGIGSCPTVTNCTFTDNSAGSEGGAGMYNGGGNPTVINCTFSENTAANRGGGMRNSNSSPTVINCTFSGNSSGTLGGGVYNTNSNPTVINCTFSGNTAGNRGGGMYNQNSSPTLTDCTFSSNSATNGNALAFNFGPSELTMANCILWDGGNEIWNNDGSTITIGYTDVQGGWEGVGNIDADPLFVDPDNGDLHLSPGSPCIDAADNTAVPKGIDTDLDGNPRFVDDPDTKDTGFGDPPIVDMGAYEFQALTCPWDLDSNGSVGASDLLLLLANWGNPYGAGDLLGLLASWGACP